MMNEITTNDIFTKLGLTSIENKIHSRAVLEILIEKGLITEKDFQLKYEKLKEEVGEKYVAESLDMSVEELKDLIQKSNK
ncbi:hypothetical protein [Alkalihalobacillus sp. R86527]|uniref:hypothetical protein n=1 Tax=Alkalihalobacillus sp. R86527 TaxID=3093863 RepID=UPI003671E374